MWEEVVAYNDLVNFIEDTSAVEEGEWKFKEILHHDGPLTKTSPNYKGSRWNVHILWETGEISIKPLKVLRHQPVVYAPSTLRNTTCLTNKDGPSTRNTRDEKR
jgi:hypothetical protein